MKERYCRKAYCYYHGYDKVCPECGNRTSRVRDADKLRLTKIRNKGKEEPQDVKNLIAKVPNFFGTDKRKVEKNKELAKGFGTGMGVDCLYEMLRSNEHNQMDFQPSPTGLYVKVKSRTQHKPSEIKVFRRPRVVGDKEGEWMHFNHSEQLRYHVKAYFETAYDEILNEVIEFYVMEKTYPERTVIAYTEIAQKIKENDKFFYGGFDAHEEDPWSDTGIGE